jgi:adenine-specific DNA-methyltransferase
VAKNLLAGDGVLVCTIDENELPSVVLLLRELFGEGSNAIDIVSIVHNPRGQQGNNISYVNEFAIFVYPDDGKKYLGDFPKDEVDARGLRDSGTESDRTDAATCFYPFIVKGGRIVEIGDVPPDDFHPSSANVERPDGSIEIWPMTDNGDEKKWRYARGSVGKILDKLEPKMGRSSWQIIFNKDTGTMRSVWAKARYDSSEYGTKLIEQLIPGSGFTYPKSLWSVFDTIKAVCEHDKNAIIMDFYAGSGTTGHAVLELNAQDGGERQFILVQIPEQIDPNEEPFKSGFKVISDITKERIKRAGAQIRERTDVKGSALDIGYRTFRIDSGNFVDMRVTPQQASQEALAGMISHIKDDRSEEDLLFGALLRWGVDITLPIEKRETAGRTIWLVDPPTEGDEGAALIACFARPHQGKGGIDTELADAIARIKPLRVLFRDDGFATDAVMENVQSRFKQLAPDTDVKVL